MTFYKETERKNADKTNVPIDENQIAYYIYEKIFRIKS